MEGDNEKANADPFGNVSSIRGTVPLPELDNDLK